MNSPDDLRSFATTWKSRAPIWSIEPSPTKSGMAIGIGWMLPWVMLSSTTARAGRGAVRTERSRRRPATRDAPLMHR